MYGVASALAMSRARRACERKKRKSVKNNKAPLPVISRAQLKPPVQKANLTYFNIGTSFILIGSFLVLTSVIPDDILGMNQSFMPEKNRDPDFIMWPKCYEIRKKMQFGGSHTTYLALKVEI